MHRKPDIIRAIILIFAVGLAVTGFTSLQASENDKRPAQAASAAGVIPGSAGDR